MKSTDEEWLAWAKKQGVFTSEDAAKHFRVSRPLASERLRELANLGLLISSTHPIKYNQKIYTYKEFSWNNPFNLTRTL